eukprot:g20385.t1
MTPLAGPRKKFLLAIMVAGGGPGGAEMKGPAAATALQLLQGEKVKVYEGPRWSL